MNREINDRNKMNEIIARYLTGEASENEVEVLLQWILESEDNKQEYLFQKQLWDSLNPAFDKDKIDIVTAEKNLNKKIGYNHTANFLMKKLVSIWSRIAAVLILPIILIGGYFIISDDETSSTPITIVSSYGCSMETSLPDGSKVWLNANSKLSYNEPFCREHRDVMLEGEAYFEINSDKKHPFVVSASDLTVTATGTAFNVNSYNCNNASVSVTLVSGSVEVGTSDNKSYNMSPGQHLIVKDGNVKISDNVMTDKYCSWRNGILDFDDDTLQDIFNRLEQIYNVKFILSDAGIANYRYHAKFNGETLSEILHLIEMTSPVKCQVLDKTDDETKTLIEVALAN
ncbi:MAG: DUF4974 domain-containing protein [Clostridiales bacterium]|nr:DUF4974 domain-containing protein [Clostridiales bacterium]